MKKICSLIIFTTTGFVLGALVSRNIEMPLITAEVVAESEKLIGLDFTMAERDSMLTGLGESRESYATLRHIKINNEVAPALLFNPLPIGFKVTEEKETAIFNVPDQVKMPDNKDSLAFYTVTELSALIKSRQISSEELTRFFLERLKKYGPKLECVITLTEEYAINQARKADMEIQAGNYKGILHGIPYGAKDLLAKKGYKTTWGAGPFKDQTIDTDATVVKKLEDAGAVLLAKLSMGALAWGDVWYGGFTRNPWDITEGSSGSSAGSASAVAAGLVPFAIGTETLGSIVSPSTVCGITGLRPTFGRVSRAGAMALSWSMDKIGPMARTAEDCAIVFNSIYGPDSLDHSLIDAPFNYDANKDFKKLRVGYLKNDFEQEFSFQIFDLAALEKIREMGVELVPIELPDYPVSDMAIILSVEAAAAFDELTRSNRDELLKRQVKNAWPNAFRQARFIPAVEYIQANRIRSLLIEDMETKMKDIDVLITPSFAGNTLTLTNLTGHPCLVLPNGFTPSGTPTSITFIGKLFGEADLITFANAYQQVTDFHRKHPVLE